MRVHATALAGSASTFFDTNTRAVLVAAHALDVSATVRAIHDIAPPERSPRAEDVSRGFAICSQSPQITVKSPYHSLQCVRKVARSIVPMPDVLVRNTYAL